MTNILLVAVKQCRDEGYSDEEISFEMRRAAESVKVGGFWLSGDDCQNLPGQQPQRNHVSDKKLKEIIDVGSLWCGNPITQELAQELIDLRNLIEKAGAVSLAAFKLVDAMETCHICKGAILVTEEPVHCEDCSYDCDDHDGPECATLESLHRNLKTALYKARA